MRYACDIANRQFDQSLQEGEFRFAPEDSGRAHSLEGERTHLIEINGQTNDGRLSLTWSWSDEQYLAQTIQKLADNYQKHLEQIIEHCVVRADGMLHLQPEASPRSSLVTIQPHGEKPPLYCVHPVGGNVFCYFELARHLGVGQPFYGLQAVGLEAGRKPHTQASEMAKFYIEELRAQQPRGPYQEVISGDQDHQQSVDDVLPRDIDPAQAERLLEVYKINEEAAWRYQPRSYHGRVKLFQTAKKPEGLFVEPDWGWGKYATQGVEAISVPGDHHSMLKAPHVRELAVLMKIYLA